MPDTRAALEERGTIAFKKWKTEGDWADTSGERTGGQLLADFAEQESSSLKLLLRAMCKGLAQLEHFITDEGTVWVLIVSPSPRSLRVELDSSGIPVLTPEILEALKNAQ